MQYPCSTAGQCKIVIHSAFCNFVMANASSEFLYTSCVLLTRPANFESRARARALRAAGPARLPTVVINGSGIIIHAVLELR